jgi:thymidylate synthase ThyX
LEEFKRKIKLLDYIVCEIINKDNIDVNVSTENFAEAHCRTVARLSQSAKSFEQIVKEILNTEGFDKEKIGNFHKSITLGVAHHSIEQHGITTLCFENTSMLVTNKYCENKRISAYLEKSTRYQDFSKPCYIIPKDFDRLNKNSLKEEYIEVMNFLFSTYTKILPKIIENIKKELEEKNIINLDEKIIKKKAFDSARYLLPASAYTNFAMTTNSQVYRSLICDLLSKDIDEFKEISTEMQEELSKVYPTLLHNDTIKINENLLNSVNKKEKINVISFNKDNKNNIIIDDVVFENINNTVKLIEKSNNNDNLIVYNYLLDLGYNVKLINNKVILNEEEINKEEINNYLKIVFNFDKKENKPHRASELANYNFEGIIDFGAWRDLHRNRMLTWISSFVSPEFGYQIPLYISEDILIDYKEAFEKAFAFWKKLIENGFSKEFAQYVCPLGTNVKILYTINARELHHVGKTRTTKFAHFSYREFVHLCIEEVKKENLNIGNNLIDNYYDPIYSMH